MWLWCMTVNLWAIKLVFRMLKIRQLMKTVDTGKQSCWLNFVHSTTGTSFSLFKLTETRHSCSFLLVTYRSVSWQTPQSCFWQGCTLAGYCPSIHHWTEIWHHERQQISDCWVASLGEKNQTAFFLSCKAIQRYLKIAHHLWCSSHKQMFYLYHYQSPKTI